MRVLFAAQEDAFGGVVHRFRRTFPEMEFVSAQGYQVESLRGFDAVIPTMTKITADLLKTADRLKLIQQVGAGLEGVDLDAARRFEIPVANVPTADSGNAASVAELGIYMMLALARNPTAIAEAIAQQHLGQPQGISLNGKTVGLVGLGGLGQALATRLHAFGMRLVGIRQHLDTEFARQFHLDWMGTLAQLPELLSQSDFVVLTLPDSPSTHHILNRDTFSAMKPGSFLINLGRGGLVEHDALEEALQSGHLGGAGLDVFWKEPPDPADPIFRYNVIATPHIGGVTDTSVKGIFDAACDNLRRLQQGQPLLYRKA